MAVALAPANPVQSTPGFKPWQDAMLAPHLSKTPLSSSSYVGAWAPPAPPAPRPGTPTSINMSPGKQSQLSCSGAIAAAKAASLHGKLRKRTNSGSSANTVQSTQSSQRPNFGFTRTLTPPLAYREPPLPTIHSQQTRSIPKNKIKPYLRKLSQKEQAQDTIDLSRSAAENETLLGLSTFPDARSTPDLPFAPSQTFRGHTRSPSYQSQVSTASGSFRPTAPFALPQPPQAYTPNTIRSYNGSVIESEYSADVQSTLAEDDERTQRLLRLQQLPTSTDPYSDNLGPLRVNTSGSFRQYATTSQSNLSTTPTSGRPRGYTDRSYDTASPISVTSFDRAFSFMRSKDEPLDPATRQASIQAARQAFTERQEAKARRYELQEQKAAERRNRKQSKQEAKRQRSIVPMGQGRSSKSKGFEAGREYASLPPERTSSLPILSSAPLPARTLREPAEVSQKKAAKSRFVQAKTWLKMKTLDLGKRH